MAYTYAPYQPETYDGKMFMVTPDTGDPFLVSVANDASEIPALVEHHLSPPPQASYPVPPPPTMDLQAEAVRANKRLDAGVLAALDVVLSVKTAMQNIPDTFNNANFIATKIQLDALTEAMAAMLQGQAALSPLAKPPAVKPP